MLLTPISGKRYIRSEKSEIFIILESHRVKIINHVYAYDVHMNDKSWNQIISLFDNEVEKRREEFEFQITSNIKSSLTKNCKRKVMKNIFNILYYTGISIMIGFVLIISLFAMNIQNILDTFAKEKVEVNIYVKDTSAYVIKPIQKQPAQIPTNKPKANQHLSVIKIENRTEDSNQVKVNLESEQSVEEPKDTNKPKTP